MVDSWSAPTLNRCQVAYFCPAWFLSTMNYLLHAPVVSSKGAAEDKTNYWVTGKCQGARWPCGILMLTKNCDAIWLWGRSATYIKITQWSLEFYSTCNSKRKQDFVWREQCKDECENVYYKQNPDLNFWRVHQYKVLPVSFLHIHNMKSLLSFRFSWSLKELAEDAYQFHIELNCSVMFVLIGSL